MLGQGYLVDCQGCIIWYIEPGIVRVLLGSIVVTYSQFDSNIRVFYVFLGF